MGIISTLSLASIGGSVKPFVKKVYKKAGIRVTRLSGQRVDRSKRYSECVIHPTLGWFSSKTANFVFRYTKFDPHYLLKMCSENKWNPSIWLHSKSGRYVLRVPKYYAKAIRKRLYRRGLWYDPATNLWNKRRRRSRKSGYPSFVQSLMAQRAGEKLCRLQEEKAKALSVKMFRRK